ncbi:hypothetical protein M427DRAFT_32319 [Gonapodya prolifera JEL478]|uniref:Pre-mRNA-processing protein 45 n=1 Tax=Gonapodya prolifera (strain JEL478) TaxID=1344416 RepID=A0A139AEU4_GONPJ|nr:hypothetical protein M427DRAFT_32319 [Gonapodya prolifera JEL478]|eukprot:KXS15342.1 hypothetical protein M427DRAFT_32319 [Gonapodya prolifera JEL478]
MSLSSVLPAPRSNIATLPSSYNPPSSVFPQSAAAVVRVGPPAYGFRKDWTPKTLEDFGDGGAYPECLVVQYPMDMGRKKVQGKALALQSDAEGHLRYDAILTQNIPDSRIVHSTVASLNAKSRSDDPSDAESFAKPSDEVIREQTERTKAALEKIVGGKVAQTRSALVGGEEGLGGGGPSFIKYTPGQAGQSGGAGTRIIRMVDTKQDPMEPARHKHKKVPAQPPSPPPPVMHSPPRKVTAEEQAAWYIPPSISSWKNRHGYTIPLDKRLASDGRGMQENVVNDNFAKLSEALFIADRHAREEVRLRAEMQSKVAVKEKREKEERLRMLAQRAREERAGIRPTLPVDETEPRQPKEESEEPENHRNRRDSMPPRGAREDSEARERSDNDDESGEELSEEAKRKAKEREDIRRERQKMRERELRMSHMGAEAKAKFAQKNEGRDISEKIALGIARPTAAASNPETMYDSRLFNRSAGMTSGFGEEDAYGLYDKPLFAGSSANVIYKAPRTGASKHDDDFGGMDVSEMEKLATGKPTRGFKGAEGQASDVAGPVIFEKDAGDPFGLEKFLEGKSSAKRAREEPERRGMMGASTAGKREDYDDRGSDRRMEFEAEGKRSRRD